MKSKYTEEKIVQILAEVTAGAKVLDTCRKYKIATPLTTTGEANTGVCWRRM
jgi:hypothetical protein